MSKLNLGAVTAYADAVAQGYKGTREQFGKEQAEFAANAAKVAANLEESKKVLADVNTAGETQVKAVQDEGAAQIRNVSEAAEEKKQEIADLDAVQFGPQEKTDAEKTQARTNIDAASQKEVDSLSTAIADLEDKSVVHTPQALTKEQQKQVYTNIGITEGKEPTNLLNADAATLKQRFDDDCNILSEPNAVITDYIPVKLDTTIYSKSFADGSAAWMTCRRVVAYDEDKTLLGLAYSGNNATFNVSSESFPTAKYVRIQLPLATYGAGVISYTTPIEYAPYKIVAVATNAFLELLSVNNSDDGGVVSQFGVPGAINDITVVGEKIVSVNESDGTLLVFSLNRSTWEVVDVYKISCDFGHGNTIDYRAKTDAMIFGNGSGDYSLPGVFYVVQHMSSLLDLEEITLADHAIAYDCSEYDFGSKLNACWGYDNDGRNDIAVLITDDNKTFRVIQLGKGTNIFDYGTAIETTGDEFNGTFRVISTHTLDDGRTSETNYVNCNQGSAWRNGRLYVCVGHEPERYWCIKLKDDGTAEYDEYINRMYTADGTQKTGASEGICFVDNYMLINNVANNTAHITVHRA